VDPVFAWYVPFEHGVHPPDPAFALYVPVEHGVHSPDPGLTSLQPALHVQAVLPTGELEYSRQSEQAEFPIKLLYFPALHCVHAFNNSPHPLSHKHTADTGFGSKEYGLLLYLTMLVPHFSLIVEAMPSMPMELVVPMVFAVNTVVEVPNL